MIEFTELDTFPFSMFIISDINQDYSVKEYFKSFFSCIHTWLIGFIIGYLNNDYDLYVKSPV